MKKGEKLSQEEKDQRNSRKKNNAEKILLLTDKYRITSDTVQYVLQQKNGKGNWITIGYHAHLKDIIKSAGEHVTKDDLDALIYVAEQIDKMTTIVSNYESLEKIRI